MLLSLMLKNYLIGELIFQGSSNWAAWIIENIIHPVTLVGIPLICFFVTVGIVAGYWDDRDLGIRSLAGALFPFISMMFLFIFQGSLFTELAAYATWGGFLLSLTIGFAMPFFGRWVSDFAAPLGAFCFASVFSILVFSYAAVRDSRLFVFYYGFALGILAHLMMIGLPDMPQKAFAAHSGGEKTKR